MGKYLVLFVLAWVSIALCYNFLIVSQFSLIVSQEEKINVPHSNLSHGIDNGVDNADTTVFQNKSTRVPVGNKNAEAAPIGAVIIKAAGTTNNRRFREDDEDRRPWVIVHVGPEKTATTTIQNGLYKNAKMLAKDDNFYFVGHDLSAKNSSIDIGDGVNVLQFLELSDTMGYTDVLRTYMKKLYKLGHHAILSAEHFTNWDVKIKRFFKRAFLARVDTDSNDNVNDTNAVGTGTDSEEPLFQFRVKIVVTYRHFFEWLPSIHYQHYLNYKTLKVKKCIGLVPYMEKYLDRLVQYDPENNRTTILTTSTIGGRGSGGMDNKGRMEKETSHLSVYSYLKWSSTPELSERVEIFDFHQQLLHGKTDADSNETTRSNNDLFANFVCQSLPSASNTCRHLMEVPNKEIHKRSSSTKDFLSKPERNLIIHDAQFLPEIDYTPEDFRQIDKQIGKWLGQSGVVEDYKSKGLKICLGSDHTRRLKVASWNSLLQMVLISRNHALSRKQKDDSYYTSFAQSSRPTNHLLLSSQINTDDIYDDSWLVPTKVSHDASFDAFVAKRKLCSLNATKLLEDKDFVRYVFGQYYIPSVSNMTNDKLRKDDTSIATTSSPTTSNNNTSTTTQQISNAPNGQTNKRDDH